MTTDSDGKPIEAGAWYWVQVAGETDWECARALVYEDCDDIEWWCWGYDYSRTLRDAKIGPRIEPPRLLD